MLHLQMFFTVFAEGGKNMVAKYWKDFQKMSGFRRALT